MEVGSVYQLDHSKIPVKILGQLGFIRVVMVSEKSMARVSVAFPSKASLDKFFGRGENWQLQPNLDLVYAMEINLAKDVLCRRIPFEEYAARRRTRSFWANRYFQSESDKSNGDCAGGVIDADGLAGWGLRKRIWFVMKRVDSDEALDSQQGEAMKEDGHSKGEREPTSGDQKNTEKPTELLMYVRKKKRRGPIEIALSRSDRQCKELTSETNLRWTQERYELAEKSILEILKTKGAVHGNPILRANLREEARKLIGDTGLLDHLLKHMAGKLAPGGRERFRRRNNQEGTFVYWLEDADLISIRKEAGVDDPYWIPPEGWKLGDSPTQDPVCAKELKKLKEDVDKIKREIQELSNEQSRDNAVGDVPECLDDVQKMKMSLLMPLKAVQQKLLKRKAKIEEQLLLVYEALINTENDLKGPVVEFKGDRSLITAAPINEEAAGGGKISPEDIRQRLNSGFRICRSSSLSTACYSKFMPPPSASSSPVFRPIARKPVLAIPVSYVKGSGAIYRPSPAVDLPSVHTLRKESD